MIRWGFQVYISYGELYEYIHVLWFGWGNNMAYREGVKEIWAKAWNKH
jgi:hypothetical protein